MRSPGGRGEGPRRIPLLLHRAALRSRTGVSNTTSNTMAQESDACFFFYGTAAGLAPQEWLRGMTGRSWNVSESPKLDCASRTPIDNRLASRLAAW